MDQRIEGTTKTVKILSLDAGGIKGIYSALMIRRLEETFGIHFNSAFTHYVGTSIGAVMSAALATGVGSRDILLSFLHLKNEMDKGYQHLARKVFEWIDHTFGDLRLSQVDPYLFIPLFNHSSGQNIYVSNRSEHDQLRLADVLKAACSDPRITQPYRLDEIGLCADACFFAYDPTLFFLRSTRLPLHADIHIVSIGSGVLANAFQELKREPVFDMLFDSFLREQFLTTGFYFESRPEVNYQRISEFGPVERDRLCLDDMEAIVEKRIRTLNAGAFRIFQSGIV